MENPGLAPARRWLGPTLVLGFATAVTVWIAAFVAHFPTRPASAEAASAASQTREPILFPAQTGPALIAVWALAGLVGGRMLTRRQSLVVGPASGVLTALLCLLILGSLLVVQPHGQSPAPGAEGLRPSALAVVPSFLGLGALLGLIAMPIGARTLSDDRKNPAPDWTARFSLVTVAAFVPLLLVGSLVTTSDSGMAIRGWPGSSGANMFLYPLSLMVSDHSRFLEHSHRLFGALVGLTTLAMLLLIVRDRAQRRAAGIAAPSPALTVGVLVFVLVCIQGGLGGARVLQDSRWMAAFHGVFAQVIFGLAVALAAILSPTYRLGLSVNALRSDRRLRAVTTGLLHASLMQLLLGAMYRHLRAPHALWTHAGFSIVVLIFALIAGFLLASRHTERPALTRTLARTGKAMVAVVVLQFLLGWAAFAVTSGKEHAADSLGETVIRTAHQANGILHLALATLGYVWTRRLLKATAAAPAGAAASA